MRRRSKGLSEDALICLAFIIENPGTRMVTLATLLNKPHSIYGKQKAATLAIAELRRAGFIKDCRRCPYCRRALTRGLRNVPLYATGYKGDIGGQQWLL
jgi:hypothetical protein